MAAGLEIERKFLVRGPPPAADRAFGIVQAYIFDDGTRSLRVRGKEGRFRLTLKVKLDDVRRHEFEYDIPAADGEALFALCPLPPLEKIRHELPLGEHLWEIDVYGGRNAGLVTAEIELGAADEHFARPAWLGPELTGDGRFANAELWRHPFDSWGVAPETLLRSLESGKGR